MVEKVIYESVEYGTVSEAEAAVGFAVLIPTVMGMEAIRKITVVNKKLVNIEYTNKIFYRTAEGSDDISGNYTKYAEKEDFDVAGYKVTAKGCYGRVFLATWTNDRYTYSFDIPYGVSRKMIEELIASLAQVNSADSNTELANPMVEYSTIFEAEYVLGYSILVPAILSPSAIEKIFVIQKETAELLYHNGVNYRMAMSSMPKDLSGYFGEYPQVEHFTVPTVFGTFHVTAKGSNGRFTVAFWNCGRIIGSISTEHGVKQAMIEELIKSLRITNDSARGASNGAVGVSDGGTYSEYKAVDYETCRVYSQVDNNPAIMGPQFTPLIVASKIEEDAVYYSFVGSQSGYKGMVQRCLEEVVVKMDKDCNLSIVSRKELMDY